MEPASSSVAPPVAPSVVAVMVAHEPGPWFEDALAALARQDYPNLQTLVLVTGDADGVAERVAVHLPRAFVRAVAGDPGFGATSNEVLRLVEGTNGFFCFVHDDVALDPDAIRLLVEEIYRSNAGIVGPKLVHWDQPRVLQHVGYGVDRFGDVDPIVEPGETDQEQHDAVRDVFAVPSACLLVRADLFDSLGGFDPEFGFHGDDVDLCWRAHLQGARVLVVPSARGRHIEQLVERRPDLAHVTMRERHRVWTAVTLTGGRRLPLLIVQLLLVTLAQFVVGLFSGQAARGWAGVRAVFGLLPRVPAIVRRRREIAGTRLVPDREVVGLQIRGIARVAAYLRSRDARPDLASTGRPWRERSGGAAALGLAALVAAVLVGGRHLVTGGVPNIGEFLPYPDSPRSLLRAVAHGWNPEGLGATAPSPTGLAVVGIVSVVTLFRMALLHTVGVIGLLVIGAVGMWRLSSAFAHTRARLVAAAVYAALPLPAELLSVGRWRALLVFALLPWTLDAVRRYSGLVAGPADLDGERTVGFDARRHVRLLAAAAVTVGVGAAFEASYPFLVLAVGVVMALATLLTGAPVAASARLALGSLVAAVLGVVLCFPWLVSIASDGGWARVVGSRGDGDASNSVIDLLAFDLGNTMASGLSLALYLPLLVAPLVGRGWRFGWATRAGLLVVVFGWLAVLGDRGSLPFRVPESGIVLVPVAVGLALAAGCLVGSLELDVRGGSFGWRQPLAVLAGLAVVVGVVPGVVALGDGRWQMPTTTLVDLLGWFPDEQSAGDYRVMWIGDERVVPAAPRSYTPGVGVALTDGDGLDVADAWSAPPTAADDDVLLALDAISLGTTTRGGRLLAPFAVRYVVVPLVDGAMSTNAEPLPPPAGLLDALGDQLDLAPVYSPPNFLVFENRAWVPIRSVLTPSGAEASTIAGPSALAQADLTGATPITTTDGNDGWHLDPAAFTVAGPSTVHVAVPFDRQWRLEVDGREVEERPAFGATAAFDVASAGSAELHYDTPTSHRLLLLVQALLWVAVLLAASSLRLHRRVDTQAQLIDAVDEPVLSFDPLVVPEDAS